VSIRSVPGRKILGPTIFFIFLLNAILFLTVSPVYGEKATSGFTPFTRRTLENGLTVIVKETHFAPVVAVEIRVGVGAIHEPPELQGISHFVEHMFFKGTKHRPAGAIAGEIKAVGGRLNASTSRETTCYYVTAPSAYTDLVLEVIADAIQHTSFDPVEVERERKVIIEEIMMNRDDPLRRLSEEIHRSLFAGTPYAANVIGTPETVGNIDREALVAYYQKHYVPKNMVVVVGGDVETGQVLARLEQLFKGFNPGEAPPLPSFEVPQARKDARLEWEAEINQTYLSFAFPLPPLDAEDSAALGILQFILDGGRSARLRKLYSDGLINQLGTGLTSYRHVGYFTVIATTQNPALVEERIREILGEISARGVTAKEVEVAQAMVRTALALEAERVSSLVSLISWYEIISCLEERIRYEQALTEVTKEDVQRVAAAYLQPEQATLFMVKPKEGK
jgi:zinc protease